MWVLTLLHNGKTSHRALRSSSSTLVGRSHEYKQSPSCLYIADLKVPKKYIGIKVGEHGPENPSRSPLSIEFHSICTTDINGTIYKLPSKEAHPFEVDFDQDHIVAKVNANKTNEIQMRLNWEPVIVLAYSKKISFEGHIRPSPLPSLLGGLIAAKVDIRTTNDPTAATHYVSLTDAPDFNLHIAVSRAIPVVNDKWCSYLESSGDNVEDWLFNIRPDLLLSSTRGVNLYPDLNRKLLLKGITIILITNDTHSKRTRHTEIWLKCLSVQNVLKIAPSTTLSTLFDKFEVHDRLCFIDLCDDHESALIGQDVGALSNLENLWEMVTAVDVSKIRVYSVADLKDAFYSKSQTDTLSTLNSSQRRKRRKLSKVNETDFFSFAPKPSPISHKDRESEPSKTTQSQTQVEEKLHDEIQGPVDEGYKRPEPNATENEIKATDEANATLTSMHEDHECITELDESTNALVPSTDVDLKPHVPSTNRSEHDQMFVPHVSLAEAIISTKQLATKEVKQDLEVEAPIEAQMNQLLLVEEIDLKRRKNEKIEPKESMKKNGRKNFKAFRKSGPKPNCITRTFIELVDEGSEIYFKNSPALDLQKELRSNIQDFGNELGAVSGYLPQVSQLFVDETSDTEDLPNNGFKFSSENKSFADENYAPDMYQNSSDVFHDDDTNDSFAFSFSRKI